MSLLEKYKRRILGKEALCIVMRQKGMDFRLWLEITAPGGLGDSGCLTPASAMGTSPASPAGRVPLHPALPSTSAHGADNKAPSVAISNWECLL